MGSRLTIACVSVVVLLGLHATAGGQQNPFRLKETDQKKACLACHTDFDQKLKKRFVHTAVREGQCSGCHDPHVSSDAKLLAGGMREVCAGCHDSVVPANARSTHKVAADGQCEKCHDPHASDNAALLLAAGDSLCFGCHKELGEAISARHMDYPVAKASCTSCHDPHGSNQPALLLNSVHAPIASRTCNACHEAPDSALPFATKRPGYELCRGCHGEMVNATLAKERLHWPVADKRGCVNCHNPHAAKYDKLLDADTAQLCGSCHGDTVKRIAAASVKHAPVEGGTCMACHSPHGANGTFLIDQPSIIAACTACHDYEQHSAHPIGDKAVDPRNKNLRVDCLSCHKAHGTEFKWMLLDATSKELCTRCHKAFAR